ncbi:MAG: hypothetical protein CM15mP89_2450 [Gammaproteobacteria bacterium]|nr:MAG: hypothetical protein CM15mP89_2450 [Gammaproteobacteria bacterium]
MSAHGWINIELERTGLVTFLGHLLKAEVRWRAPFLRSWGQGEQDVLA